MGGVFGSGLSGPGPEAFSARTAIAAAHLFRIVPTLPIRPTPVPPPNRQRSRPCPNKTKTRP